MNSNNINTLQERDTKEDMIQFMTSQMYLLCWDMRERASEYGVILPEPWNPLEREGTNQEIHDQMVKQYFALFTALKNVERNFVDRLLNCTGGLRRDELTAEATNEE